MPQVSANRERKFKNGAGAFCLHRAVSTMKKPGESIPDPGSKLRILEHAFRHVSPNERAFLLSQKMHP